MDKPQETNRIISKVENASNVDQLLEILEKIKTSAERRAEEYQNLKKYAEAIREYRIVSKAYFRAADLLIDQSKFPRYRKARGTLLSLFRTEARRWEKKHETLLQEALEKYKEEVPALEKEKRYYEMLEKLKKALELDPGNAFILSDIGVTLYKLGDFQGALEKFEKAIEEKPDYEQAYLLKGQMAFYLKQYEIAEGAYSTALTFNRSADALCGLGVSLAERKSDYKQARKLLEEALEFEPDSTLIKANLAEVMFFLKEYTECQDYASWVRDNTSDIYNGFLMRLLLVLSNYLAGKTKSGVKAAEDIIKYSGTISRFDTEESWDFSKLNETVKKSNLTPEVKKILLSIANIPKLSESEIEYSLRKIEENIAPKGVPQTILSKIIGKVPAAEKIISAVKEEPIDENDIQIRNTANPDPDKLGYYDWEIFLDVPEHVLSKIVQVKYILHPTFPEREIIKENRDEYFKLERNGWGEFNVKVIITLKDGQELTKYHWLKLGAHLTTLLFQSTDTTRFHLRKDFTPGRSVSWFVSRYKSLMHPGQIVLLWNAKGKSSLNVKGLYGWGITTGEPKHDSTGKFRINVEYIERWISKHDAINNVPPENQNAPVSAGNVLALPSWKGHLLATMPIGTNFLVTQDQLDELLNQIIDVRFPSSQLRRAVNSSKYRNQIDPSEFKHSLLSEDFSQDER